MELPMEVLVHNDQLGVKGGNGTLLRVAAEGYYELNLAFGDRLHRVCLPIQGTALIAREAEESFPAQVEIER